MLVELLKYFMQHLVDKPEQVIISQKKLDNKSIIEIRVASKDLAKVIGKEGQVFKALRNLINLVDPQSNIDLVVDVVS